MTQCDRALAGASRNSQLPSGISWAAKKGLEVWMANNTSPDPGPNANFCYVPPQNFDVNWMFNNWPR